MLLFCIASFSLSAQTFAGNSTEPTEVEREVVEKRLCKKDSDERMLDVFPVGRGCTLEYVKDGKAEIKAKSSRGVELCREKLKRIVEILERSGFKCD